jgi:hypothetical protein
MGVGGTGSEQGVRGAYKEEERGEGREGCREGTHCAKKGVRGPECAGGA